MGVRCGGIPCVGKQLRNVVIAMVRDDVGGAESIVGNNVLRKRAYQAYTQERHVYMRKRRRVVLPACIMAVVRALRPDELAAYMASSMSNLTVSCKRSFTFQTARSPSVSQSSRLSSSVSKRLSASRKEGVLAVIL